VLPSAEATTGGICSGGGGDVSVRLREDADEAVFVGDGVSGTSIDVACATTLVSVCSASTAVFTRKGAPDSIRA